MRGLTGRGTESVDLEGRTLLPGFIDPHMHTNMVQLAERRLLDRLVPDLPLLVMEGNTHVAYVNAAVLAAAGVDAGTADPPAGQGERCSPLT